jgi:dienelactone hydrolase
MKLRPFVGLAILSSFLLLGDSLFAQKEVTFPLPNQAVQIHGDLYGKGPRAIILAHGGRFHKESWKPQALALANAGFMVLSVGFRGDHANPDGTPGSFGSDAENTQDVLAAVAYLHSIGAKTISAVGGSLGGDAVGNADTQSPSGTFDRIVILASEGGDAPEKLTGRKLFILARDDTSGDGPRLPGITSHYEKAAQPKKLVLLDGSAHAQFLFATPQGPRLLDEILHFLTKP